MADDHTRALTARHPITPTSPRCLSAWQPNRGRRSTYRRGKSVQTTGTTSLAAPARERVSRFQRPQPVLAITPGFFLVVVQKRGELTTATISPTAVRTG